MGKAKKEEADRKAKEAEEKKKKLEEAEAERQKMLEAQKAQKADANEKKKSVAGGPGNDARKELSKTKEQLEEEKKIALSIRIKPLELEAMDSDEMKSKAEDLFKIIVQLETDKYDYEQRKLTQELDLKELKERQKAQLRAKASKKLPKWFGERPGKKAGAPETPEGEEEAEAAAAEEEDYDEEEEEEEEYDEEEE